MTSRRETPSYALHDYPHQTSAFMPRGWEKMQYFRIHSLNLTGPYQSLINMLAEYFSEWETQYAFM